MKLRQENAALRAEVRTLRDAAARSGGATAANPPDDLLLVESWRSAARAARATADRVAALQQELLLRRLRPRSQLELIEQYLRPARFDMQAALAVISREEQLERATHALGEAGDDDAAAAGGAPLTMMMPAAAAPPPPPPCPGGGAAAAVAPTPRPSGSLNVRCSSVRPSNAN